MIIVIRISGLVEVPKKIQETLFRMRLRRKYSAVLIKPTFQNLAMLKKIRNFIAYGDISKEMLSALLEKRAASVDGKKIDVEKVIEQLEKKDLESLGIKPFFRLHPPRKGIDSKLHFPIRKGVLGDNKGKINDLVRRML
ncbi:MAG: uL30 family ribosomal protein [Nanoarchaeota archaeon]